MDLAIRYATLLRHLYEHPEFKYTQSVPPLPDMARPPMGLRHTAKFVQRTYLEHVLPFLPPGNDRRCRTRAPGRGSGTRGRRDARQRAGRRPRCHGAVPAPVEEEDGPTTAPRPSAATSWPGCSSLTTRRPPRPASSWAAGPSTLARRPARPRGGCRDDDDRGGEGFAGVWCGGRMLNYCRR
ncbi:hypothetical protein GGR56DRAFT_613520 [Xylariaceae sp. FL0804]|nr:hypothetical protein GGR56DRAFT_613520 [Xylariaceae sp. FL0804]